MKKIIVFGATGNVGSYFTKYALEFFDREEYTIIASGRRKTDFWQKNGVEYCRVDISNHTDFESLPQDDVYAVVLLSAQIPLYTQITDDRNYIYTNIVGTYNVLEYAKRVHAKVMYTTTISDSSAENGLVLDELFPHNYLYSGHYSMYAITKSTGVSLVRHYCEEYGMQGNVFRLPTIYNYSGNRYYYPNGEKRVRPLWLFIERAMKGEPIELWGDPMNTKEMLYVYDCAQMICKAIEKDIRWGFFNVGTGIPITMQEELDTIIDVFSPPGKRSEVIFCPEKQVEQQKTMEIKNAIKLLGYKTQYGCRELLIDMKKEMQIQRFRELESEAI